MSSGPSSRQPSGGELAGLGMQIAVGFIAPLLLGEGFDLLLRTRPIGVLVGLLIGITAGSYIAFVQFKRFI
ncbi:MAG TPA: AtpZ/AtpI family protein [Candidatus Saccharimonadales bacterium]|nr:AtpZ/AtpI family protein [Candidatus Saccharimonadales bacterium]